MKREFGCFVLFLLLLLCGCTTNVERRLMRSGLDSINQCNRNSLPFTIEDVQPYVRFFDKHGTANDKMLAHYLLGRAYHENGDSPMALECYQHAIESADTADTHCDFSQLSRVYAQKAAIFFYQDLYRQQIEHLKQSVRYAWMAHDTLAALMSYEQEALSYERIGKSDSSIYIIEDVAAKFEEYGHSSDAAISLGLAVGMLMDKGDYQKAKRYMDLYESKSGYFDSQKNIETGREIYYKEKGMYYLNTNRLDSAEYYFRKELHDGRDYNNKNAAAMGLALLYEKLHRSDSVAKYALYAYAMNDSLCAHKVTSTVEQIQSLYNYTRHQEIAKMEEQQARQARNRLWNGSILVGIVFVACMLFAYQYRKRKKGEIVRLYSDYLAVLSKYNKSTDELRLMKEDTKQYEDAKQQDLEMMRCQLTTYKEQLASYKDQLDSMKISEILSAFSRSDIVMSFHRKAAKTRNVQLPDNAEWKSLYETLTTEIPLVSTLIGGERILSVKELHVCLLLILGFSNTEIYKLVDLTPQHFSNLKRTINRKLFGDDSATTIENNIKQNLTKV